MNREELRSGDVVVVDFPGVTGIKRRPAVVVSSDEYHRLRRDMIIGTLTSQIPAGIGKFDWILGDWQSVGLHQPTAFKAFLVTLPVSAARKIGRLSSADWKEIQNRLALAIELQSVN